METPNENYDVIIIGAGPAGLSCAGGLTRKGLEQFGIPDEIRDCNFKKASLHTPRGSIEKEDDCIMIATVGRKALADWQLGKLKHAKNVTIRTGCKVTAIDEDSVTVNGSTRFGYKYLVGADGSFSKVRGYLNIKTERIATAIQYIIPTEEYEKLEVFFDSRLFGAWYA